MLRVLHCPALVGGQAAGLAQAERELGLESRTLVVDQPPYGYEADLVLAPAGTGRLIREVRRWRFVLRSLRTYDVVHFNFGSTLLPAAHPNASFLARLYGSLVGGRDLQLLPERTAVFVTYQGDDARQARARFAALPAAHYGPAVDAARRRSIARFARRADGIFALNPDLLDVLPPGAEFLPYASVDLRAWTPVEPPRSAVPVVVHAPTDRGVKGTDHLVRAAEALDVELVLVEGMSRAEARAAYARADVVVDQLLVGWYGGLAVEAMALAKPVVAYIADEDLAKVPAELASELPIVRATPDTVAEVLRELVTTRRGELPELGRRGRAFVERWHDPLTVARTTSAAYAAAVAKRS